MKKININQSTAPAFAGVLAKLISSNNSMVFPSNGVLAKTSKFGNVRKITSNDPHKLTTKRVRITITDNALMITNPLNKSFGYSEVEIPFGTVTFAYGSFFWIDKWGYWRQMSFSKDLGWALVISGGRSTPYYGD